MTSTKGLKLTLVRSKNVRFISVGPRLAYQDGQSFQALELLVCYVEDSEMLVLRTNACICVRIGFQGAGLIGEN